MEFSFQSIIDCLLHCFLSLQTPVGLINLKMSKFNYSNAHAKAIEKSGSRESSQEIQKALQSGSARPYQ